MTRSNYGRPRTLSAAALCIAFLSLLMASASSNGAAHASTGDNVATGVGITPARSEVDLGSREYDLTLDVFNDSDRSRAVTIDVVGLGHELDGTPLLGDALSQVRLVDGEQEFTLGAGESVELSFRAAFPGQVSLYGAVVARIAPDDAGDAIAVRTQVASLLLLRGPRPWDQSLEARGVGLLETGEGQRVLYVDLANVGNAHVRPKGVFRVRRGAEVIAEVPLAGENILPGFARRLTAPWTSDDAGGGDVEIEIDIDDGPSLSTPVDLGEMPAASDGTGEGGEPGSVVLEQPTDPGQTSVDGDRRVLLPIAGLLILLAIGALYLMLLWKRREEEDDEDEPVVATAAPASGGDEGS